MAGREEQELRALLAAWPELTPDAGAVARLSTRMTAAMRAQQMEAEPNEALFRLILLAWSAVALTLYFLRPLLLDWFRSNLIWTALLIVTGGFSLIAPLVLLPVLRYRGAEAAGPDERSISL